MRALAIRLATSSVGLARRRRLNSAKYASKSAITSGSAVTSKERRVSGSELPNISWVSFIMNGSSFSGMPRIDMITRSGYQIATSLTKSHSPPISPRRSTYSLASCSMRSVSTRRLARENHSCVSAR